MTLRKTVSDFQTKLLLHQVSSSVSFHTNGIVDKFEDLQIIWVTLICTVFTMTVSNYRAHIFICIANSHVPNFVSRNEDKQTPICALSLSTKLKSISKTAFPNSPQQFCHFIWNMKVNCVAVNNNLFNCYDWVKTRTQEYFKVCLLTKNEIMFLTKIVFGHSKMQRHNFASRVEDLNANKCRWQSPKNKPSLRDK